MPAAFRQLWPDFGVDETKAGVARMIVPLKIGGNIIALVGAGKDVKPVVESIKVKRISITEFDITDISAYLGRMLRKPAGAPAALGKGVRYFFVTALEKSGGSDGVLVTCDGASLRVNTSETRNFKIAIRHVAGSSEGKNHSRLSADLDALVGEMNDIWMPQANISFTLVKSDKAKMGDLPEMVPIDRYHRAFLGQLVGGAAFTFFLLYKTSDPASDTQIFTGDRYRVRGVASSDHKYALISDDRSNTTMAHEAGHLLKQKHTGTASNLLMREGGAGSNIPYDLALSINGKY